MFKKNLNNSGWLVIIVAYVSIVLIIMHLIEIIDMENGIGNNAFFNEST